MTSRNPPDRICTTRNRAHAKIECSPYSQNSQPALAAFFARLRHSSASAQSVDLFPANHDDPQHEVWTRVAIPPDHPVSNVAQWHIDYAKKQIVCDGNGGHEWLRFNRELTNFTFHVKWRFTPVTTPNPKYNTGVFFRNNLDGSIWHQAQTSLAGGYIFGLTPIDGKPTHFNLQKEMRRTASSRPANGTSTTFAAWALPARSRSTAKWSTPTQVGLDKGYIGLEAEGYQITFKDLKVKELRSPLRVQ